MPKICNNINFLEKIGGWGVSPHNLGKNLRSSLKKKYQKGWGLGGVPP